jgi:hypothetical protein
MLRVTCDILNKQYTKTQQKVSFLRNNVDAQKDPAKKNLRKKDQVQRVDLIPFERIYGQIFHRPRKTPAVMMARLRVIRQPVGGIRMT